MTDGYLSKDREHIAGRQRQRRARMARIDYYPSPDALALIESRRTRYGPTNRHPHHDHCRMGRVHGSKTDRNRQAHESGHIPRGC